MAWHLLYFMKGHSHKALIKMYFTLVRFTFRNLVFILLILHPSFYNLYLHPSSFSLQFSFFSLETSCFILHPSTFSLQSSFSIQIMCVGFPHCRNKPFSLQDPSECPSRCEVERWQYNAWRENAHQQEGMVNHSTLFFEKELKYEDGQIEDRF